MAFWQRKPRVKELPAAGEPAPAAAPVATAAPVDAHPQRMVDPESMAFLASLMAFEGQQAMKGFDWNHYLAMVGGSSSSLFTSEFNLLPTGRIIKAGLITEPWINACTRAISRQFQCCRFLLERRQTSDGKKVQQITRHPFLDYLRSAGSGVEDQAAFYANVVSDLVLPGNAYWWTSEDLKDKRRLPAERVEPVVEHNRITRYRIIERGEIGLPGSSGSKVELAPEEVTHLRLPNPFSPHVGLSMVIAVTLPVLIEKYGREYVVGFFLRGGTTAGIIQTQTSNIEQLTRLARSIMQAFGGRKNMHADKVLPAGAEWKASGSNFADLRLVELLKDNVGHFRAATGCTNTVLGIVENIVYATARAEMELFWKSTILPLQQLICSGIKSSSVWGRFGLDDSFELIFDNSGVEWLDTLDRRLDQDAKLAPVATVNERRERLGYPRIERFDDKLAAELAAPPPPVGGPPSAAAADPSAAPAGGNAVTAPTISLNGAQVAAIIDVVTAVAEGRLPRSSGIAILETAFALSNEQAEAIMGDVGAGFVPEPPPAAEPTPPPADAADADADEPEEAKAAQGLVRRSVDAVWKAEEERLFEPPETVVALFRDEFRAWEGIVIENLEHRNLAQAAILGRAEAFAEAFAEIGSGGAMKAWDRQADQALQSPAKALTTKDEPADDHAAKIALLRERARQVIEEGIFESGRRGFVGYSETAMDSIYGFIEAEIADGRSLADVAAQVRLRFHESYGTGEAYAGQAETIVRTEWSSAVSIGQARFGDDLASVTERMQKTWITLGDQHVRDSHLDAEAQGPIEGESRSVMATAFVNGLRYPREAGAPGEEVINCRCSIIYEPTVWGD